MKPDRLAILCAVALSLAANAAEAQPVSSERALVGGVEVGVGASEWVGTKKDSLHLGALLGGFAVYHVRGPLSAQAELLMVDKGANFEDVAMEDANEALLYLELPLLARYDLALTDCVSLHGMAGPGVAVLVDSKRTPREDMRKLDFTVTADVGADFETRKHHVSVDLRFGAGLVDSTDDARKGRAMVVSLLGGVTL